MHKLGQSVVFLYFMGLEVEMLSIVKYVSIYSVYSRFYCEIKVDIITV